MGPRRTGRTVKGWQHRPVSSLRPGRPQDGRSSSSVLTRGLSRWGRGEQEPKCFPQRRGPHTGGN